MPPINSAVEANSTLADFQQAEKLFNEYSQTKESPIKTAERASRYIPSNERAYLANIAGRPIIQTFEANQTIRNQDGSTFTTNADGRISSFTIMARKTRYTDIRYSKAGMVTSFKDPFGYLHERMTANRIGPWKRTNLQPHPDSPDQVESYSDATHTDITFTECGAQFWDHNNKRMFSTTGDGSILSISRTQDKDGTDDGFKTTFYPENGWQVDDRNVQHLTPTINGKPSPEPGLVVDMYQARLKITVEAQIIIKIEQWTKPSQGWNTADRSN